ncbi:MAG: SDR family oxidoreductase [Chloroflexi bacterium]|nr:SDR family oxidoreductase [Chloroflexota bacterium]
MRALVAGGAGFVGSHLCDALIERGFEVICVDNLMTGHRQNVAHLMSHPHFEFLKHDVCKPLDLEADWVFQLASPASPPQYQRHPVETLMVNAVGTQSLLDVATRSKGRFLLASTSEIYGDPEVHPQVETYRGSVSSTGLRSCYDEGKRFAEALTMAYLRARSCDTRIVRIFNTYGPRLDPGDGRVMSNFLTQVLQEEPITMYGSGEQTRSFCYVSDLVAGILTVVESDNARGEVINLGNPGEISLNVLRSILERIVGHAIEVTWHPLPEDDPRRRQPDISKAKRLLGWEPKIPLEEGLRRTLDWYRGALEQRGANSQAAVTRG